MARHLLDELALALECEAIVWQRRKRLADNPMGEAGCKTAG
jgi:hypothetical protein